MKLNYGLLLLVLVLAAEVHTVSGQVKSVEGKRIRPGAIDSVINLALDSAKVPGLVLSMVNGHRIVFSAAYGYGHLGKKSAIDTSTIFEACSLSKSVFAYFVMKLVDRGILSLDTPLSTILGFPELEYDPRYKQITTRMALCHTSGLPNWREYSPPDSVKVPEGAPYLLFPPGTAYNYSGEGYQYLARTIAKRLNITMNELDSVVRQEVFIPLEMQHSKFGWNEYIANHKATGYRWFSDEKIIKEGEPTELRDFHAAGGLHTTVNEFARFMIALINGDGLTKTSHQEMLQPQSTVTDSFSIALHGQYWGLGVAVAETPYGTRYMHTGDNGDFQAFFVLYKKKRSGFVFLINGNRSYDVFKRITPLLVGKQGTLSRNP